MTGEVDIDAIDHYSNSPYGYEPYKDQNNNQYTHHQVNGRTSYQNSGNTTASSSISNGYDQQQHRKDSSIGYNSFSGDHDVDDDDQMSDYATSNSSGRGGGSRSITVDDYHQPHRVGSFNVDQMLNMRESNNFRDSLAPAAYNNKSATNQHGRATEMGNALMRMDENYRRTASGNIRMSTTSAEGLTPLLQAARAGDLVLLNALVIQPGTDILRRDPVFGQTALHFAIRGGHLGVVQALLMPQLRGSIVNVADNRRNTALHLAAAKSRRMTKVLLDNGADVNFLNMRNQTPLGVHILTVTKDDPTMTEILLQADADPNAPVDKSTTLHVALDKGLYQIAQRLVRHGARLDAKDESGKMVFEKVDHALLKLLLSKVAHRPVWVPDSSLDNCMECKKKFSTCGSRRHHCRACGRLLCSSCASCHVKGSQLPFADKLLRRPTSQDKKTLRQKQRVCTTCYELCMEGDLHNTTNAPTRNP